MITFDQFVMCVMIGAPIGLLGAFLQFLYILWRAKQEARDQR